uniref:Uncharacterized protein n=2 Tax=Anguilla anguilla TaxID=7936 RepID=A0A0E9VR42_ANGAN
MPLLNLSVFKMADSADRVHDLFRLR